MTKTDIARRVYDHAWKLDPIVRSLLDTDFYKLLMLQMIWKLYPEVDATFSLINRTQTVRLADEIDEQELRDQLDHARTLRFTKKEMIWLAGNTFYGTQADLRAGVPAPGSRISSCRTTSWRKRDGQYELTFAGPLVADDDVGDPGARHHQRTALARGDARTMGPFALDVLYARAKAKMWAKVERLQDAARTCASPISARAAATPSCGSAGASRR